MALTVPWEKRWLSVDERDFLLTWMNSPRLAQPDVTAKRGFAADSKVQLPELLSYEA